MTSCPSTLKEENAAAAMGAAVGSLPHPPRGLRGRGIVIPAGGVKYFPGAWVCIRTLRDVGCTLPIEVWHAGSAEVDEEMRRLVEPYGVTCIDAEDVCQRHPARFLRGWPLKPFAMLHSGFGEVLLLDADNIPVVDPTFLFDEPEYRSTGAIFWPDKGSIGRARKIWRLTDVAYRREPAVESAQLLVDKSKCWAPLALAVWMNCEHCDFWYRYIYGDKDTFHFAWRRLGIDYAMPPYRMGKLPLTMVQHDFHGRPIFQHRHHNKWALDTQMLRIPGFQREEQCLRYLAELRERWSGHPARPYSAERADAATAGIVESLLDGNWTLRSEDESLDLRFTSDGRLIGGGPREAFWNIWVHPFDAILSLIGSESVAWMLARGDRDRWVGRAPSQPGRSVELVRRAAAV